MDKEEADMSNVIMGKTYYCSGTDMANITIGEGYHFGSGRMIIDDSIKDQFKKEILQALSYKPLVQHKCHSCGATLTVDEGKHIFICKYCDSVYAFDTAMINDIG